MGLDVGLNPWEFARAATVGVQRQIAALLKPHTGYTPKDPWGSHIEGACGELGFAKGLNFYWDGGVNTYSLGQDVFLYQVRTRSLPTNDLIIRPQDKDDDVFVLVVGKAPNFTIVGWIFGFEAKQKQFWQVTEQGDPAWFVPQAALYCLSTLPGRPGTPLP